MTISDVTRVSAGSVLVRSEKAFEKAPVDAVTWARGEIVFSACNEASACEVEALAPMEGKRVFCVSAGGGRVLNLLPNRPREVWAVDLNPAQNALLELKIAGLRALDHAGYLGFLGARPARNRIGTYERLRRELSAYGQRFWDSHADQIETGVLFAGKLESFFARLADVLRLAHPFGLERLFAFTELHEQQRFLARWDTVLWRTVARNAARRGVLKAFSGDPGFYRYVPEEIPLHSTIYDRVHTYFHTHVARENPLLQLVFFGRYIHEPAMPIYLNEKTHGAVKAALADVHVEIITSTVDDALDYAGPAAFDAFSISDICSYLDDDAHDRLFGSVLRAGRHGARLCSRSNLHHRPLLAEHARRIVRDREMERRFSLDDHSCVHEFLVGEIV